jgi:hypothetical protein
MCYPIINFKTDKSDNSDPYEIIDNDLFYIHDGLVRCSSKNYLFIFDYL